VFSTVFGTNAATTLTTNTVYATAFATSRATNIGTTTNITTVFETLAITTRGTATSNVTDTVIFERLTGMGTATEVASASAYNTSYWDGSQWTEV